MTWGPACRQGLLEAPSQRGPLSKDKLETTVVTAKFALTVGKKSTQRGRHLFPLTCFKLLMVPSILIKGTLRCQLDTSSWMSNQSCRHYFASSICGQSCWCSVVPLATCLTVSYHLMLAENANNSSSCLLLTRYQHITVIGPVGCDVIRTFEVNGTHAWFWEKK